MVVALGLGAAIGAVAVTRGKEELWSQEEYSETLGQIIYTF